jgi:hypothetical protein
MKNRNDLKILYNATNVWSESREVEMKIEEGLIFHTGKASYLVGENLE